MPLRHVTGVAVALLHPVPGIDPKNCFYLGKREREAGAEFLATLVSRREKADLPSVLPSRFLTGGRCSMGSVTTAFNHLDAHMPRIERASPGVEAGTPQALALARTLVGFVVSAARGTEGTARELVQWPPVFEVVGGRSRGTGLRTEMRPSRSLGNFQAGWSEYDTNSALGDFARSGPLRRLIVQSLRDRDSDREGCANIRLRRDTNGAPMCLHDPLGDG